MSKKRQTGWTTATMAAYMHGRAMSAIDQVAMLGKPIAQVGQDRATRGRKAQILQNLRACLGLGRERDKNVLPWIRERNGLLVYGYYHRSWSWVLELLNFVSEADIPRPMYHAINGLLFGYRLEEIQKYIDREMKKKPARKIKKPRPPRAPPPLFFF